MGDPWDATDVAVWRATVRRAELSVSCREFALLLATHADDDSWPSVAALAAEFGCSKVTAHHYLAALASAGWIETYPGGGRRPDGTYARNLYELFIPTGVIAAEPDAEQDAEPDDAFPF